METGCPESRDWHGEREGFRQAPIRSTKRDHGETLLLSIIRSLLVYAQNVFFIGRFLKYFTILLHQNRPYRIFPFFSPRKYVLIIILFFNF